jgi:hypothetical protein
MTQSTPGAADDPEAGRPDDGFPDEESRQEAAEAPIAAERDGQHVPDKQIGRWKDDGGAVDFTA